MTSRVSFEKKCCVIYKYICDEFQTEWNFPRHTTLHLFPHTPCLVACIKPYSVFPMQYASVCFLDFSFCCCFISSQWILVIYLPMFFRVAQFPWVKILKIKKYLELSSVILLLSWTTLQSSIEYRISALAHTFEHIFCRNQTVEMWWRVKKLFLCVVSLIPETVKSFRNIFTSPKIHTNIIANIPKAEISKI